MKKKILTYLLIIICISISVNANAYTVCNCGDHSSGIVTYLMESGGCCTGTLLAASGYITHYAMDECGTWTMTDREYGTGEEMHGKCCK